MGTTNSETDIDALEKAMEKPTFKVKGRVYGGEIMGYLDFNRWSAALGRLTLDPAADEHAYEKVIRGALEAMQFNQEAQDALLGAPRPLVQRVLKHFFALHRTPEDAPAPAAATPADR